MNANHVSAVAFLVAAASVVVLTLTRHLVAGNPVLIAIQIAAAALMVWARVTFGRRSFHATAGTSSGGLVTTGPYRFWRHPIYASLIYFVWAGQGTSPTTVSLLAAGVMTLSLIVRMLLEERALREAYPGYDAYSKRAKRFIPFVA